MTEEIKTIARRHLAERGSDLSLRAVAREMGMVSSAVYRYFGSRDELLTALILDGYAALGDACDRAEAAVARADLEGRWLALARGARAWATAHPAEYALLYGSPVPGYAAPQETVEQAIRPLLALVRVLRDGVDRGVLTTAGTRLPRGVRADLNHIGRQPGFSGVPAAVLARGVTAWVQLFGVLSFELFGRLPGGVTDYDAFFDLQMRSVGAVVGFAGP